MPFEEVIETEPFRMVAAVWGREKCGKTHFAFTFPEPIWYIRLDAGGDSGVVEKFMAKKKIYRSKIQTGLMHGKTAGQTLLEFEKDYGSGLVDASEVSGTVIVDTYTQIRQLIDNDKLGEVKARRSKKQNIEEEDVKVLPFDYSEANNRTGDYINQAWNLPRVNLVLIHRAAKVYDAKGNEIPGQFKMQGWGEVPAYASITLRMDYLEDKKQFQATIESCRSNHKLRGFTVPDPDYAAIAGLLGAE